MDLQEYLDEECKRIKKDVMQEFSAMHKSLNISLQKMELELELIGEICSYPKILQKITPTKNQY